MAPKARTQSRTISRTTPYQLERWSCGCYQDGSDCSGVRSRLSTLLRCNLLIISTAASKIQLDRSSHSLILVWHNATTVKIHHLFLVENIYPVFSMQFASVSTWAPRISFWGLRVERNSMFSAVVSFLRPLEPPELASLPFLTYAMI
jgi:hypothetical protein